ncbi:ATP-binding protein [uncultured Microbacterium sp.]|uniref:sensor histidine kinase n=1 Tax=uncultured Microbacterium sp. TaxID=191216 RepID=UPI0028D60F72|nr:ATP-binding protein [uncultured Microbacterium sp.]
MTTAPTADAAAGTDSDAPVDAAEPASAAAPHRSRRRWSLQTRLMVTVIGIVSLILVIVAIATSAALGRVLEENLDRSLDSAAQQAGRQLQSPQFSPGDLTAYDVLNAGRQEPGFLFIAQTVSGDLSGAYVGENLEVERMTTEQIQRVVDSLSEGGFTTVSLGDGLGDYRIVPVRGAGFAAIAGLPVAEVRSTIAATLTTIALVTAGGLLLLAAAIAFVIRAGLKPLRAVADTATRVASLPLSRGAVSITERVPDEETDEQTEIGRVGHALNTLLDHVSESLDARQRNEERMRRFVADASHELRTPLASIRGFSELSLRALRQGPTAPAAATVETTEASLERIQAQSIRMTGLVEDLLLLARLDEGQELVYGTVDLSRLAIDAIADATPAGPDHGWELDLDEEPVIVTGDSARLHQVVGNLLANARTHTPAGTDVTLTVARDGSDAVLRVHDDGPGVDPGIADDLFERFSRADRSRARKTGGTGLGLSIAQAIVTAHGGSLAVQSTPGSTTFEVRLPLAPTAPAVASAELERDQ